jgi:hypothetical protein
MSIFASRSALASSDNTYVVGAEMLRALNRLRRSDDLFEKVALIPHTPHLRAHERLIVPPQPT